MTLARSRDSTARLFYAGDVRERFISFAFRFVLLLGGLAFATFFGAFAALAFMPAHEPGPLPWSGWAVRGFLLLTFGSLAAWGLAFTWRILRRPQERPLPAEVLARCPACGEPWPEESTCTWCGLLRMPSMQAWREDPSQGAGVLFLLGGGGSAITCLGLVLGSFAFDTHELLLIRIGFVGLGLLLLLFGGFTLSGGLLGLAARWKQPPRRAFSLVYAEGPFSLRASASIEPQGLTMQGLTERWWPIHEAPTPPEVRPTGEHDPLVQTLAVLHARGEASLRYVDRLSWNVTDAVLREVGRDIVVEVAPSDAVPVDERDRVRRVLHQASVTGVAALLETSEELRADFATYAARLSTEAVDPRISASLAALLTLPRRAAALH